MKKFAALVLVLCMLTTCLSAFAATGARITSDDISTRSGPGTDYTEPGTFLYRGAQVTAHTKAWDSRNQLYWVQVEFTSNGQQYRAYTGAWRLDVDLNSLPDEQIQDYSWFNYSTRGYAGPGYDYYYYDDIMLYQDGNCRVMEVENNFALVDSSATTQGMTRVWVPLSAVAGGSAFYGADTYEDGPVWLPGDDQGATLLPGGNNWNSGGNNGYNGFTSPIGQYVTVWVDSGHARSGPGTGYSHVEYVNQGDVLQVIDFEVGDTGKDWYQVRIDGRLCWVSSGLVTLNGNSEGTLNGVPILAEDPLAEYPQTNTHLIGRWIRINPTSAHVRQQPHTSTPTVGYVTQGQTYEILDCRVGNTGKAWYKIYVEGEYGWVSSGLTTLLGY